MVINYNNNNNNSRDIKRNKEITENTKKKLKFKIYIPMETNKCDYNANLQHVDLFR